MANIKPAEWIVCYYGEKIYLNGDQYKALINGLQRKLSIIRIDDLVLTDKFTYICHKSEIEADRLNEEEMDWAIKIGKWLSRPVHNLDFTPSQAFRYGKKLVKRIGVAQVIDLWKKYADSAYTSAIKFMAEAKEIESEDTSDDQLLLEE